MFSLILSIIAIVLVIVLVGVMFYYGGSDTVAEGRQKTMVAQALNEVGQISAAIVSYRAQKGEDPQNLQDLYPDYLSSIPAGWGEGLPENMAAFDSSILKGESETQSLNACNEVNYNLGHVTLTEPPLCSDLPKNFRGCCQIPASVTEP